MNRVYYVGDDQPPAFVVEKTHVSLRTDIQQEPATTDETGELSPVTWSYLEERLTHQEYMERSHENQLNLAAAIAALTMQGV